MFYCVSHATLNEHNFFHFDFRSDCKCRVATIKIAVAAITVFFLVHFFSRLHSSDLFNWTSYLLRIRSFRFDAAPLSTYHLVRVRTQMC